MSVLICYLKEPVKIRVLGSADDLEYERRNQTLRVSLKDGEFDKNVTVLALFFDENPKFQNSITISYRDFEESEEMLTYDTDEAIYLLVRKTHLGVNFFKVKINDDGSQLDDKLVFGSEETKNE